MKVYLNITFIVFIIVINFILPNTTFAVEQGIQIPSSSELSQLSTTSFKYQWIKFQYVWGSDQPINDWVKTAKDGGYKVLVSVAKKPNNVPKGEEGYKQFGTFMQELSAKLDNNVDAYEIWNEPNLNDEWSVWGQIDPTEYIKLLQEGAKGVKAGNPNAKVVSAALAPLSGDYDDEKFFNEFVKAGGLDIPEVDAIGWHSNVTSNIDPQDDSLQGFQRVKIALGKGKPVWITEFGWDRDKAQINRQTQLKYIQDAFGVADQLGGIQTMIIWNFGFGKLQSEFLPWDISTESTANSQQQTDKPVQDNKDSGCTGLSSHECALKLKNIASLPENISKNISSETPKEKDTWTNLINGFLNLLGLKKIKAPDSFSTRSDVQVKTSVPDTAQSQSKDKVTKTGENLGYNADNANKDKNVRGATIDQKGIGIYQLSLPKQIESSLGASLGFECAYEISQYPAGIRPISNTNTQAECNTSLGTK